MSIFLSFPWYDLKEEHHICYVRALFFVQIYFKNYSKTYVSIQPTVHFSYHNQSHLYPKLINTC